jgi:hypothetical protein
MQVVVVVVITAQVITMAGLETQAVLEAADTVSMEEVMMEHTMEQVEARAVIPAQVLL